ncbi:hypothetical protein A2U01_0096032, partial [Trifolium medium]|nr:hypothetical protein [Trifolium medium]
MEHLFRSYGRENINFAFKGN